MNITWQSTSMPGTATTATTAATSTTRRKGGAISPAPPFHGVYYYLIPILAIVPVAMASSSASVPATATSEATTSAPTSAPTSGPDDEPHAMPGLKCVYIASLQLVRRCGQFVVMRVWLRQTRHGIAIDDVRLNITTLIEIQPSVRYRDRVCCLARLVLE